MKTKILNALRTEYANLGLGDKAFDGVASFLEKTITEEGKIAETVKEESVKALLKSIQGESDSLRNKAAQAAKDLEDYKKSHPEKSDPKPPVVDPDKDKEPEWARKLREKMEARELAETRKETLSSVTSALKNAGCTQEEVLRLSLVGFSLKEGETQEQAVARIKADYDASVKKIYGESGVPTPQGGGAGSGDDDATVARRQAWVNQHRVDTGQETKTN